MSAPQDFVDLRWGQRKDSSTFGVDVNSAKRRNDTDVGQTEIDIEAPTQTGPHYQARVMCKQRHCHLAPEIAIGAPSCDRR